MNLDMSEQIEWSFVNLGAEGSKVDYINVQTVDIWNYFHQPN